MVLQCCVSANAVFLACLPWLSRSSPHWPSAGREQDQRRPSSVASQTSRAQLSAERPWFASVRHSITAPASTESTQREVARPLLPSTQRTPGPAGPAWAGWFLRLPVDMSSCGSPAQAARGRLSHVGGRGCHLQAHARRPGWTRGRASAKKQNPGSRRQLQCVVGEDIFRSVLGPGRPYITGDRRRCFNPPETIVGKPLVPGTTRTWGLCAQVTGGGRLKRTRGGL